MRLKNKKTGEIIEFDAILPVKDVSGDSVAHLEYGTLTELNSEWEDAPEEPKEYWYIDYDGGILCGKSDNSSAEKMMISMGNHFDTLEEAEKAVEKLKAWKRMKDTGCKPIMWKWKQDYPNDACYVEVVLKCQFDSGDHDRDLDLIFGGEK